MSHVTEWLRRLRISGSFQPTSTTMNSHETSTNVNTSTALCNRMPISAIVTPAKPHHCSKRLMSSTESKRKNLQNVDN